MKKLLLKIDWIIDYYFVYFLYNTNKLDRYDTYMKEKWGEKYTK
jgi:hypothetical protein